MTKLKRGDKLPAFTLQNQEGNFINIADYFGKPFVIYFYPKDDTPGCTVEACSFRDNYQDFTDAGARVFGISNDSVASHKNFKRKFKLPFDLLSDPDDLIRKFFGVPTGLLGLLPGRVTYIIDHQGYIVHIFNSQINFKKHVTEAIQVIKSLNALAK
jgi:peroxiredoxin Q/BCP